MFDIVAALRLLCSVDVATRMPEARLQALAG
jgi:hypothetical protein